MEIAFSPGDPFYLVVILSAIIFASWWVLKLIINLKQAILSKDWSPEEAVLTEIQFDRRSSGEDGEEFRPKVTYNYKVKAKSYSSERVSYRYQWSADYAATAKPFSGLVVGSVLPIYVNPDRPEQAVVLPGADYACYLQLFVAFVFLGFAINGLVLHIAR